MYDERFDGTVWSPGLFEPSLIANATFQSQGLHWLEKYLNIQNCLEKSLKIKFALKSARKTLKGLEKSLNFTIYRRIQHCLWRPKSCLYLVQQFYTNFLKFISLQMQFSISKI